LRANIFEIVVAGRLASDALEVHGWVFEIERSLVTAFDPASRTFVELLDVSKSSTI
jgi:carbonic anhydrase